nr:cytochrome P450 4c3-like [Onthophagus taurus]
MHIFGKHLLLICDPEKAELVLSSNKLLNKSWEYKFFHRWLGTGLLTSGPEKWKKTRKILTPTFHFQILEQYINVFNSQSNIFVQKLKNHIDSGSFDVYPYVTLLTLDVICEAAMGVNVHAQNNQNSKYVQSVQKMSRIIKRRVISLHKFIDWIYYFSSDFKKEAEALKVLHGYTNSVISKRKEELLRENFVNENKEGKQRMAFLDLLLHAKIDGVPLSNEEIRQEVDTFMFEGHDTTASAVAFSLYSLSQNSLVQTKAFEEQYKIFGDDQQRCATYNELQNMKYLEIVIKEVLRLYPSVFYFGRETIEDIEIDGFLIPKGVHLVTLAYGIHRKPEIYFDPEKFDPNRFLPENNINRHPYSFVPFSAGPRNCIGQKFAMLEMKTILSTTLRRYEILPVENFKPAIAPDVILKSRNGVMISLRKRLVNNNSL